MPIAFRRPACFCVRAHVQWNQGNAKPLGRLEINKDDLKPKIFTGSEAMIHWFRRRGDCFPYSTMYRLSRRFRRRFGKDKEEKKDKHALDYVVVLLDGSDLSFNLHVSCFYCFQNSYDFSCETGHSGQFNFFILRPLIASSSLWCLILLISALEMINFRRRSNGSQLFCLNGHDLECF